tara:strand:+ start:8460 stop:9026 length:567 start_codon:yes stop_codon:yes gene_type:complete
MVKKNTCVFISGQGSNLKNLINKSRDYNFPINIKLVICNNLNAKGLNYARKYSIPFFVINTKIRNFEQIILDKLKKKKITLVCLAGYMKILSNNFLKNYRNIILNIHPSLLPKFKGLNTFSRILRENEIKTGCTVHYVNEKLDGGKKIVQKSFFINSNDNENDLKTKTQKLEYLAYPEAIIKIFNTNS